MSGHTPGKWVAIRGTESTGREVADWAVAVEDEFIWVCTGPEWGAAHEIESFANARLIAADPDLLELAECVVSENPDYGYMHGLAVAAIAKATGGQP